MESGFEIDGATYPVPTFETFTMDEAQILYDYSGLAIEDFVSADPDASEEEQEAHEAAILQKAKNPAFKRALAHIAYQRGNPTVKATRVKEIVGRANMVDIALGLAGEDEDESPPDETATPVIPTPPSEPPSSPSEASASSVSSGSFVSEVTSSAPDAPLASIGATR